MLKEIIDTFEKLKNYVFIINRGNKKKIIIQFKDENFFHLVGLHKTNIDMFFPNFVKTKKRKYTYIKKNINKFESIISNQIAEKNTLKMRIFNFSKIISILFDSNNTSLLSLKVVPPGSSYKGDFGLLKIYEDLNCLLCLKIVEETDNVIICSPQSYMVDKRILQITEFKMPQYIENIIPIPIELYNETQII